MNGKYDFIKIAHELGKCRQPLERAFSRMLRRDLFLKAYSNLYSNEGAMTKGVDPEDSIDGMSIERADKTIEKLKEGNWRWTPVRRKPIPKSKGGKRPISIPTWRDKLVQEVMRMVLEAYFEPIFLDVSHGFRPARGCHTALLQVKNAWTGTTWFIEGDIKACFDNIDHEVLLKLLSKRVPDLRFLKLVRGLLKAGYIEDWKYGTTYSGTPQGGVISPILANVVLHELDCYVMEKLKPNFEKGERRAGNKEYRRVGSRLFQERKKISPDLEKIRALKKRLYQIPSRDLFDPNYRRLKYVRYADDFLIGIIGTKEEARQIKTAVSEFLQTELKLTLSEEKTLITHAVKGRARFLGYNVSKSVDNRMRKVNSNGVKARHINHCLMLSVPNDVVTQKLRRYCIKGKPHHRTNLIDLSDPEIIERYEWEVRGLYEFYKFARDVGPKIAKIRYAAIASCVKTLANKHKCHASKIYRKYYKTGKSGTKCLVYEQELENGKILRRTLGDFNMLYVRRGTITDTEYHAFLADSELIRRVSKDTCELCEVKGNTQVHHVRKLKPIRKAVQQGNAPRWKQIMASRNRKTLIVCLSCHNNIHSGRYDGRKL
jgi:group II intron reverse transcriptase/maturase